MRRIVRAALAAALLSVVVAPVGSASAAPRPCADVVAEWGSRGQTDAEGTTDPIVDVRTGRHRCFDRFVVEVDGDAPGYRVKYVNRLRQDGSGRPVAVDGGAILRVIAIAPAYDERGRPTFDPDDLDTIDLSRYRTFRDLAWAGSFEGQTTLGIGVRARLPFRVLVLDGPDGASRLVVDVAHRWPPAD